MDLMYRLWEVETVNNASPFRGLTVMNKVLTVPILQQQGPILSVSKMQLKGLHAWAPCRHVRK